jgi:hypothetical protein
VSAISHTVVRSFTPASRAFWQTVLFASTEMSARKAGVGPVVGRKLLWGQLHLARRCQRVPRKAPPGPGRLGSASNGAKLRGGVVSANVDAG